MSKDSAEGHSYFTFDLMFFLDPFLYKTNPKWVTQCMDNISFNYQRPPPGLHSDAIIIETSNISPVTMSFPADHKLIAKIQVHLISTSFS